MSNIVNNYEENLLKTNKKILKEIEKEINDSIIFSTYFSKLKLKEINDFSVVFIAKNNVIIKDIKENYLSFLTSAIVKTLKSEKAVEIILENTSVNKVKEKQVINNNTKDINNFVNNIDFKDNLLPDLTFKNLVTGKFNENLIKIADNLLKSKKVEFTPIFIHSKSGLGKTHFLNALGNAAKEVGMKSYFLNPDAFTNQISLILKEKDIEKINNFSSFLESVDIFLIDDVQMLGSRVKTLEFLFNIINNLKNNKKQIIICSDKKPELLGGFEDRFITRFQSGLTLEIKKPNNEDLLKILKFKIEQENFDLNKWDNKALSFLTRNFYHSIREIEGALNQIKFSVKNSPKDLTFNENLLNNIFHETVHFEREITHDRIIESVCSYYRVKEEEVRSKSRKREIVIARSMIIYLIRELLSFSYERIGIYLGGKDHSTIMASYKKIEKDIETSHELKNAVNSLTNKVKTVS
ncbi:chromosomal replication initiator protein DnaA [Mycoplasma sp. 5370]